eukprot:CAMPEP_0171320026 /NCGR_PEP_ID=MMETSP0816-20121228/101240_1 /TAXON_ID=420281 /ORGANISM="Proboscia inermis, Strain CCAP1064/1" /LENGTH=69 /DNA_ID=CAMNT_0011816397 /DNA_START=42 /DNA_END=248 /DNA_ORIENTATION=-
MSESKSESIYSNTSSVSESEPLMVFYPDLGVQCFLVVMDFDVPFKLANDIPEASSKSESKSIDLEFDDT